MSRVVQHSLITARFFSTFGHFIALIVLFMTIDNNIQAGLPDGYSQADEFHAKRLSWVFISFLFFFFSSSLILSSSHLVNNIHFRRHSSLDFFVFYLILVGFSLVLHYFIHRYSNLIRHLSFSSSSSDNFSPPPSVSSFRLTFCKFFSILLGVFSCLG